MRSSGGSTRVTYTDSYAPRCEEPSTIDGDPAGSVCDERNSALSVTLHWFNLALSITAVRISVDIT